MATSPRRNMMSEVIVKASHLERINAVHGGSCVTQGTTTKTKPTIYNYDRRLLKPRWDWMTGKEFLPKKQETNKKQSGSRSNCGSGDCGDQVVRWVSHGFTMLFYLHPQTRARGHGIMENMRKHGRHGHHSEPVLAPNALRKENSSCSVVWTIIFCNAI